jgi:hypothetical protein
MDDVEVGYPKYTGTQIYLYCLDAYLIILARTSYTVFSLSQSFESFYSNIKSPTKKLNKLLFVIKVSFERKMIHNLFHITSKQ